MVTATETRSTGTELLLYDDHLNDWEDFAGQDINIPLAYEDVGGPEEWEQGHWSYRGQAAMCMVLDSSKIVRVRIGDGSTSDRQIYKQEITDPTIESQWTTWSLLYSGDHYAVAVEATSGSSFRVIHAKSDGNIYLNNVLAVTVGDTGFVIRIKPVRFWPGALYFQSVYQDTDGERAVRWDFCADITLGNAAGNIVFGAANYRWYRSDLEPLKHTVSGVDTIYVLRSLAETQARNKYASQTLLTTSKIKTTSTDHVEWEQADYIKGPSGQAGYRIMEDLYMTKSGALDGSTLTGYYYALWTEQHHTALGESLSNLAHPCFWARSYANPNDWSAPVPVGYSIWGLAGMVTFGSYVYLAGNGRVLRRPDGATSTELSDYVLEGRYSLPRGGQPGTGDITLANPDNTVGSALGLEATSDAGLTYQRIRLRLGLKGLLDTDYSWKDDGLHWVTTLAKNRDSENNKHVVMTIGDFRARMETPFAEPIAVPGKLSWSDWGQGATNQPFNYSNDDAQFYPVDAGLADGTSKFLLVLGGTVLFTGWRGENGQVRAHFSTATGRIVFRYQDANNYYSAEYSGSVVRIYQTQGGTKVRLTTASTGVLSHFTLEVDFRWDRIRVYINGTLKIDYRPITPAILVGFVGFGVITEAPLAPLTIAYFYLAEWNRRYTVVELLAKLAAYTETPLWGYASGERNLPELQAEQINLLWGPQSDLKSPGQAFDSLLATGKLEARYNDDSGLVEFGRFDATEDDVVTTIENEIITQEHTSEGERPNVVSVDGNLDSWVEYDRPDLLLRQRRISKFVDDPNLNTPGDVKALAEKEILDARRFNSPGGDVVWFPQWSRLFPYFWIDEDGQRYLTRIEGMEVSWNQSVDPFQHAHLDMGTMIYCPPTDLPDTYIARDTYQRTVTSGWDNAQTGGNWVIT